MINRNIEIVEIRCGSQIISKKFFYISINWQKAFDMR